jgi:hypothetical protein
VTDTPPELARPGSGTLVAVDRGTATTAVSLLARIDGSWRLLAAGQAPAAVDDAVVAERLRARVAAADPTVARAAGLATPGSTAGLPRIACSTERAPEIAVIAATRRVVLPLADAAATAGWRVRPMVIDGAEILPVVAALADSRVTAVLAGASDPPGADERSLLPELGALVAAAADRRPDLITVLSGGLATPGGRAEGVFPPDRLASSVLAPAAAAGGGAPLRRLLDGLRGGRDDGRRALATATATMAEVLQRGVEVVEVGQSGAMRAVASWSSAGGAEVRWASVPAAALLPAAFTDVHLDAIMGWLTAAPDRLRIRDRLRELAIAPWSDAAGEGALLRMAAARAALARLAAATRDLDAPPADVTVAAGGAWAVAPGPAVGLALADVLRRPGVRALGWDHSRLLAPLGTIEDPDERRAIMADLRDELLLPLGSLVLPAGLRAGHAAGTLTIRGEGEPVDVELVPGGLELVDLPPGERATVELRFRDPVDLGVRLKHAAVEVAGGLGGLIVDLRDVPLRLPDRPERRRDLLTAWQGALWAGVDT